MVNANNLQECVQKFVATRRLSNPECPMSQHVANAYHHCRNQMRRPGVGGDSKSFTNQILANEGVLEYSSGRKLKRWKELKTFDTKMVPIIDEHPGSDNGNDGKVSGREKIWGIGLMKQCVKGEPVLCFDSIMEDDAPVKHGYSIGFVYNEIDESGDYFGSPYDSVQAVTEIDHIALTNFPRNPISISTMDKDSLLGNDTTGNLSNNIIVKYHLGYDSFSSFRVDTIDLETHDTKNNGDLMPGKPKKKDEDEEDPKEGEDEEKEEEMDEEKKEKNPFPPKPDAKPAGDSELERYKKMYAEKSLALDSANVATILANKETKRVTKVLEKNVGDSIKVGIDALLLEHPTLEITAFDGKNKGFVDGALFMSKFIQTKPKSGVFGVSDGDANESDAFTDINDFHFDADSNKMVKN